MEQRVGGILPCNVILRHVETGVEVSAIDPVISALLVHDQVTGAQQVIKNILVRQRPVCGQVDIV